MEPLITPAESGRLDTVANDAPEVLMERAGLGVALVAVDYAIHQQAASDLNAAPEQVGFIPCYYAIGDRTGSKEQTSRSVPYAVVALCQSKPV